MPDAVARLASRYLSPVPKHRRVTVSRCKELSDRLLAVASILKDVGVRVAETSRLQHEAEVLLAVYDGGRFPVFTRERKRVANAVHDALEFEKVLRSLPAQELRAIASEVKLAIKGTAEREESSRQPYQFQSQLYVGCVLRAGLLKPRVPLASRGPSPDYLVTITTQDFAVEVKRPESEAAIDGVLRKAKDQIRASGLRGGVILDVTDCIDRDLLFVEDDDPRLPPYHLVEGTKERLLRQCVKAVSDETERRHRPGYESLLFLLVYFNGWRWTRRGPSGPEPFTGLLFQSLALRRTLEWWHTRDFYEAFTNGSKANRLYISRETLPEE